MVLMINGIFSHITQMMSKINVNLPT